MARNSNPVHARTDVLRLVATWDVRLTLGIASGRREHEKGEAMTRSKVVAERAKAADRRIGTRVVTQSLGHGNRKLAKVVGTVQQDRDYLIMIDTQGVAYLRVAPQLFILNTGSKIELIQMDEKTILSRALTPVPQASVVDAAKILAQPLTEKVIISDRAKKYLDQILNDKEFITMAKAKKTPAAKKEASKSNGKAATHVVVFKKMAKEDDLPKQAFGILNILKAKGKATIADLQKAMEGKIETKQPMSAIWGFYRAKLIKGGFITVQ